MLPKLVAMGRGRAEKERSDERNIRHLRGAHGCLHRWGRSAFAPRKQETGVHIAAEATQIHGEGHAVSS
jgi:hypothetical protein